MTWETSGTRPANEEPCDAQYTASSAYPRARSAKRCRTFSSSSSSCLVNATSGMERQTCRRPGSHDIRRWPAGR